MELGELKTFVTVVAEHRFSLAAIRLCRTQPAVSQAIRRLEEDLGEGDALLPEAIRLLRMADDAAAMIRVPRATVSSLTAHAGVVAIPLLAARAARALTLLYRDNDGQPNAVEDFVEVPRGTAEDRVSRQAPIALRVSR